HLLGGETGIADKANAIELTADHTGSDERLGIDHTLGVKLARVDIGLHAVDAELVVTGRIRHVEATLGHTHVERHLTALEAADRDAGAGRLALATATAGLADARADTTADAHALLVGARVVPEFV